MDQLLAYEGATEYAEVSSHHPKPFSLATETTLSRRANRTLNQSATDAGGDRKGEFAVGNSDHKPSRSSEQTLSEPENDWHGVVVSHIKRRWLPCEDDLVNYYPVDHRWSVQGSGSESAKQLMTERVKQFSDAIETEFETDRKELLSLLSTNVPELKIRRKMRMAEMVAASRVSNKGDYRAFEFDHYLTKKLKRSRMERDAKRGAEWYPKK